MAQRPKRRGKECRKCQQDRWVVHTRGWACVPCNRERSRLRSRARRTDQAHALWESARARSRETRVSFSISVDDVRAAWPADGKCPALGIPLRRGTNRVALSESPTLDRLNDAWGYDPGNIAIISMAANRAKGRLTADELERLAAWMRRMGLG